MERTAVHNLMAAIVTWITEHDSYATKTKLLKLLYLFDVEYYRHYRRTFTGFRWKFFHLGPWASEYDTALKGLIAHGILKEQHSNSPEYDTAFYKPNERVETRHPFSSVKDEGILVEVLKRWGTRTTGEILNYVYFQTEPMEAGIRNELLDFSRIPTEPRAVYSRSSSGKSPADIRRLRAEFERRQAEKKALKQRPFTFTAPKYDEEYFDAIAKLQSA